MEEVRETGIVGGWGVISICSTVVTGTSVYKSFLDVLVDCSYLAYLGRRGNPLSPRFFYSKDGSCTKINLHSSVERNSTPGVISLADP